MRFPTMPKAMSKKFKPRNWMTRKISLLWTMESLKFKTLFIAFNIFLGVYNFLSFRAFDVPPPCVVVVNFEDYPRGRLSVVARNSPSTNDRPIPSVSKTLPLPVLETNLSEKNQEETALLTSPETLQTPQPDLSKRSTTTVKWEPDISNYFVVTNYVVAKKQYVGEESVTFTTHGTLHLLKHTAILCQRWNGPVSVSVYVGFGGNVLTRSLEVITHLRRCHACVMQNVSWHLIFESRATWRIQSSNGTAIQNLLMTPGAKAPSWRDLDESYSCTTMEEVVYLQYVPRVASNKVGYPINVARNVARTMAKTRFVLAADIELYPSDNIIPRFLNHLASGERTDAKLGPRVYVLPVFEVPKAEEPPNNKADLVKMLREDRAIFFHQWLCDACHNFPGRPTWHYRIPPQDDLGVHVATRNAPWKKHWEPVYIGTNEDPLYDEGLTWEGKRDKMLEMCLMNYTLHILDNAFLVHAPGIKTTNRMDSKLREPFVIKNNMVFDYSIEQMKKSYHSDALIRCLFT